MSNRQLIALCTLSGLAVSSIAHAGPLDRTLYAITDHQGVPGNLVAFDPDNPADAVTVGSTNTVGLVFLTYDPRNDFFIASTETQLYQINKNTGNASPYPVSAGTARLAGHTYAQSRDQMLVAYSLAGDSGWDRRIGEINADGSITQIADFNGLLTGFEEIDEIIWNPDTESLFAFCAQARHYYELDIDNTLILDSQTFTDSQTLIGADRSPDNGQIYMVDRVPPDYSNPFDVPPDIFIRDSTTLDLIGNPGLIGVPIDDVNGLAFIPTPGATALLGLGGLAMVRRRR